MEIGDIMGIAARLERAEAPIHDENAIRSLAALEESIGKAEAAWSGSWLGYHSRVYYKGLNPPPGSAKFSHEWGLLEDGTHGRVSTGEWRKCRVEDVIALIWKSAGHPNVTAIRQEAVVAAQIFEAAKHELLSRLKSLLAERENDEPLARVAGKIRQASIMGSQAFIEKWMPPELAYSRDEFAVGEGMLVPPHMSVKAEICAIRHPFTACGDLAKSVRRLASHLSNSEIPDKPRLSAASPRVITVQPHPPVQPRKSGKGEPVSEPPLSPLPAPPEPQPPAAPVEVPIGVPVEPVSPFEPAPRAERERTSAPLARPIGMRAPASSTEEFPEAPVSAVQRTASPVAVPRAIGLKPPDSVAPVAGDETGQTGICLCHGRSSQWKDLRDALRRELPRDYREFNLVPLAGVSGRDKMDELCRDCGLAVLILTEEDIRREGDRHAETNAIHTAGIFQGRLGYGRVVLLIEEGCEGLSHLQDLPQISYPKADIAGVVGGIRAILDREGLLHP